MKNNIEKFEERLADQVRNRWTNYQKKRISLTSARTNEQFFLAGAYICVEKVSDKDAAATIRLNKGTNDELDLVNGVEIETLFGQFYITNTAQAGKWLDLIIGADFKYKKKAEGGGLTFVDRGDVAVPDFTLASYIIDGNWHDLDLSSIIDPGTVLALTAFQMQNSQAGRYAIFCKKGYVNNLNRSVIGTQAGGIWIYDDLLIRPDENGFVQYLIQNAGIWGDLNTTICGWFV